MSNQPILVIGATGKTGSRVAANHFDLQKRAPMGQDEWVLPLDRVWEFFSVIQGQGA